VRSGRHNSVQRSSLGDGVRDTLQGQALKRAFQVWGLDGLARRLDVSADSLRDWLNDEVRIPRMVALQCIDLLNAHDMGSVRRSSGAVDGNV